MGGPCSVTLPALDMIKTEKHMRTPLKPIFYKKFVDDIYNRRKKDIHDNLSERLKIIIETLSRQQKSIQINSWILK